VLVKIIALRLVRSRKTEGKRMPEEEQLREQVRELIANIYELRKRDLKFIPSESMVHYAGRVIDERELISAVDAILDGWWTYGKYTLRFEGELARTIGAKFRALLTNSGSSANLLAVSTLMSPQLRPADRLKPGDEVITLALAFPTTFNPIIQNQLVPVLVDVDVGTYNIRIEELEKSVSEKTKAIFVTHTLGNPNDMDAIMDFAQEHNLYVLEDSCDALGSKYDGKYVGTFGAFGTFSFYPAHHITTGEGGALVSADRNLMKIALSLRDWGRACIMPTCDPLHCPDKECPKSMAYDGVFRFQGLPDDFDKRYIYTNIGYNLKATEIQAAIGLAQLRKLPSFIEARKRNFKILYEELKKFENFFTLPQSLPKAEPSWFAFPLTVKKNAPFKRRDIMLWLTKRNIESKILFSGNIIRHPAYTGISYRVSDTLTNTDDIAANSFFLGVYPGIDDEKMKYIISSLNTFMADYGH
jgi:CDP-6-deoxy-D-xylo-4-hexulose-3-dehydrase